MPLPNWPSSSAGGSSYSLSHGTSPSLTVATVSNTAPNIDYSTLEISVEWSVEDPTTSPDTETCAVISDGSS